MTTTQRSRRPIRLAALVSIAVIAASIVALPAASGASKAKWITISSGNVDNTVEQPSIAKFGSSYEAIWTAKTGSKYALDARILNAAGKPVGGVITVLSKWNLIGEDPTIFAIGSTRYVAFTGDRENSNSDPYNAGVEDYATSQDGKTWTLGPGSLSQTTNASQAAGTSVINSAGTPITAMALDGGVKYHVGIDTSNRPAASPDSNTSATGFSADAGVGRDAKTGQVWALWASGNGGAKKDGVWAQPIIPSLGTLIHAPGSYAGGGSTSYGVEQDLSAASRTGGGVYTAYVTSAQKSIDVWKVGAKKPFATLADHNGPSDVVVTPGPAGRIWVYWRDASGWHATRSNKAATRFGPITSVSIPKGDSSNFLIAGTGPSGPLEAVALITTGSNTNEVVVRQILPILSVSASPHAVKRGHSFTVKVTDAGDPVKGATVHFDGTKKKTNKKGEATFKVPGGASTGKSKVSASLGGYGGASTKVTIDA
jgi:hypothetical protein